MQVEAVQISTALDWAIRLIGGLVALNLGTLVYIFKSLKSEVKDVGQKVSQLDTIRFKLVHKDDCRHALDRVHERIDSLEERVLLTHTLTAQALSTLPPYYALCFIMKL